MPLMRITNAQPPGITKSSVSREIARLQKQEKEVDKLLKAENAMAKPRPIAVARIKQAQMELKNKITASGVKARKAEWGNKESHNAFFTLGDLGATETSAPSVLSKLTSFFTTGTGAKLVSTGAEQLAAKQQSDMLKKQTALTKAQLALQKQGIGSGTQMASGTLLTIGALAAGGALLLSMKGKKRGRRR